MKYRDFLQHISFSVKGQQHIQYLLISSWKMCQSQATLTGLGFENIESISSTKVFFISEAPKWKKPKGVLLSGSSFIQFKERANRTGNSVSCKTCCLRRDSSRPQPRILQNLCDSFHLCQGVWPQGQICCLCDSHPLEIQTDLPAAVWYWPSC